MIARIMMEFAPDQAAPLIREVMERRMTVREGVERMFGLIPSSRFPEVVSFAQSHTRVREGFAEFVALCERQGWLLAVVSGGFDFFVEPALAPFAGRVEVFCNRIDATGPVLRVVWAHPCDELCQGGCGLCKPAVVRRHRDQVGRVAVIGDGVTDIPVAQLADWVFARDKLLDECRRTGLPHSPFDTFHDIIRAVSGPQPEVRLHD
ncbi:MAG: MtnX-like HAD-IB family phosphatase [Alicyclobacillaceae bacterium]|nr:MtnX-like HAD-IB family phosphatase [Alicyclobacillaceae bacterium]